jgi:hypothetical protein
MTPPQTTEDERTYAATVTVNLPGYKTPTVVKMQVQAHGLPQATEAIIAAWYAATELKDIAIKEIATKVSGRITEAS